MLYLLITLHLSVYPCGCRFPAQAEQSLKVCYQKAIQVIAMKMCRFQWVHSGVLSTHLFIYLLHIFNAALSNGKQVNRL